MQSAHPQRLAALTNFPFLVETLNSASRLENPWYQAASTNFTLKLRYNHLTTVVTHPFSPPNSLRPTLSDPQLPVFHFWSFLTIPSIFHPILLIFNPPYSLSISFTYFKPASLISKPHHPFLANTTHISLTTPPLPISDLFAFFSFLFFIYLYNSKPLLAFSSYTTLLYHCLRIFNHFYTFYPVIDWFLDIPEPFSRVWTHFQTLSTA